MYIKWQGDTVTVLIFKGRYFHEFHEKLAIRENIIVNVAIPTLNQYGFAKIKS